MSWIFFSWLFKLHQPLVFITDPPEEPRARCAAEKWFEEELVAPLKMANDARSCPTPPTAATATDTKAPLAAATDTKPLAAATATWTTWTRATLAPVQAASKSIVMNMYLDCDAKDAAKIVGAANRATRALCQLDSEVPSTKHLVIVQGPDHEVKKAKRLIESQLEELHMELSGHKLKHVTVEGVGSVEVCIIQLSNPIFQQVSDRI